jgi:ABC-2 type transport system ATP-binding protein
VHPTTCRGTLLGFPVGSRSAMRKVGYLPEQVRFAEHLTARQFLELAGKLYGQRSGDRTPRVAHLLKSVAMDTWADERMGNFSKGMRQRIGLAQALMGDPQLVFLDEPTDGVDPMGRKEIRDMILHLKSQGKTVFINSHLLSELELICDRVAILQKGAVVKSGTIQDLTQEGSRYLILAEGDLLESGALAKMVTALGGTILVTPDKKSTNITIPTKRAQVVQPLIDEIRRTGHNILSVTPERQTLEELFIDTLRQAPPPIPAQTAAYSNQDTMH